MENIEIFGGVKLIGETAVQGSKNAAIPIMAAALMINGEVYLKNCPQISDVADTMELLTETGCSCRWENDGLFIDASKADKFDLFGEAVKATRTSILMLGALAGRMGSARTAVPGGCSIGKRPVDKHLEILRRLGIDIKETEGFISCRTSRPIGNIIKLDIKSVGVTENAIIAAALAKGTTVIYNAAREPEIRVLCDFLNSAGARIKIFLPDTILIEGVKRLHGTEFRLPPDRIVAGTYLTAIAASGGFGTITQVEPTQLEAVLRCLEKTGSQIFRYKNEISVVSEARPLPIEKLVTAPYPGFPTDMQSQMMVLLSTAGGISTIDETVFESRFLIAPELNKLGASVSIYGTRACIKGVPRLFGCTVEAKDLRGGAALVIAGLMADGKTIIKNSRFIKRGYADICMDLKCMGANIKEQCEEYDTRQG